VGPYSSYLVETFVTLVVVCGLAFVVLYGARRLGVGQPSGAARLVGRLPLDARRAVYLVKVGAKVLVVGASEAGLTKLGEMDETDLPKEEVPKTTDFGDVLARAMGKKKKDATDGE
jgi:flagellar protein FliO/FliZ